MRPYIGASDWALGGGAAAFRMAVLGNLVILKTLSSIRDERFLVLPVYGAMSATSDGDAPCTLYTGGESALLAGGDLEK